jgi:hypothetical protein
MTLSISWPPAKMALIQLLFWIQLSFAVQAPQKVLSSSDERAHGPSIESASANAAPIFNALHSSMVCKSRIKVSRYMAFGHGLAKLPCTSVP